MPADYFIFPVSSAQQRLWILDQMMPDTAFYNLSAPIRLPFPVNILVLKKSLNEIVRRHEILRTTFKEVDGQPCQLVVSSLELDVAFQDLTHQHLGFREDAARQLMSAEARRQFNLETGPLVRTFLYKVDLNDYIFQITMHHIISDAWSQIIFIKELTAIYEAFVQGKPAPLPELPIQYADYTVWQREYLQGEILDRQVSYWKEQLAGILPLALPTDKKRPAVQSYQGNIEYVTIPKELTNKIKSLSQQENATFFMTLMAAFATLLYRYTGQEDIVIGAPVAGRTQVEVEHLIGFFINSLVIRTDLSGNPTFSELLQRVKKVSLEAFTHGDLPFEKLVEELHPDRDLSRNPLFQVSFQIMQFQHVLGSAAEGNHTPFLGFDKGTAIFDLRVTLTEEQEMITGEIEYSTDLFEKGTIQQLWRNYQELLALVVEDPRKNIAEVNVLPAIDRNQLLDRWNQTKVDFTSTRLLHELFEQQVIQTPLRTAVAFGNQELTYEALNNQANKLARFLIASGISHDNSVGVYMERSEKMIIVFLAILKAGAAYIPLDPAYPKERTQMILEDAGIKALITQRSLLKGLTSFNFSTILLDEQWLEIAKENQANLALRVHPLNIAYVIYTSGSTGKPKGVQIPHAAICNHMLWMKNEFPLDAMDIVLQRTPFSFDASVWEFYAPLISGARLQIAEEGGAKDPDYLIETVINNAITVLQVVPSLLKALLDHPKMDLCSSLKRVYCGGEPLSPELIRSFYRLLSADLYNLYGPTEATIDSTCWLCRVENKKERVPIGKPISNIQTYVLDDFMNPVPIGVAGELWIGGEGLARGYLNKPSITAAHFVPDPFSNQQGARLYRTGDRVHYRADGNLEYIERIDHQVKLRGYRIELGEVEATIRSLPMVKDAVVVLHTDGNGNERLIAYVVPVFPDNIEKARSSLTLLQQSVDKVNNQKQANSNTILLNDPSQHLSSIQELVEILGDAIQQLPPGGSIVVNNIRSLPLLDAFNLYRELSDDASSKGSQLLQHLIRQRELEKELVIDPEFFITWKQQNEQVTGVEFRINKRSNENDLSQFRYDVILHVGVNWEKKISLQFINWDKESFSIEKMKQYIEGKDLPPTVIKGIPVPELYKYVQAVKRLREKEGTSEDVKAFMTEIDFSGLDPALAVGLEGSSDNNVYAGWWSASYMDGCYDLLIMNKSESPRFAAQGWVLAEKSEKKDWNQYATNPMQESFNRFLFSEIKNYLEQKLPEYMIPSYYISLDHIPLKPNGKLDRQSLPAINMKKPEVAETYVPPRNELEKILAEIWSQVLGVELVGIHDNFFKELGGNSLLAIQLVSRMREHFQVHINLQTLFLAPTIQKFAEQLDQLSVGKSPMYK